MRRYEKILIIANLIRGLQLNNTKNNIQTV